MKRKNSALRASRAQNRLYRDLVKTVIVDLRKEQKRRRLGALVLARMVGLNASSSIFKSLYNGSRVPTFRNLVRTADALGMRIEVRVLKRRRS